MKTSKVTAGNRYLRILVFGKESAGKTHFMLSGPGEVLVFDVEGRIASMVGAPGIKPFSRVEYDEAQIVRDFVDAATEVRRGREPFQTFGLDSYTDFELRVDRANAFSTKLAGDARNPNKQFALADKRTMLEREILNATLTGPTSAHFVWTAHQKNLWEGRETAGFLPDGTRNLMHYFDLAFHMQIDQRSGRRTAVVAKSNYQSHFRVGQIIEDLSWSHLEPIVQRRVDTDNVNHQAILEAYEKAGKPNGTIHAWFEEVGFEKREGRWSLTPEERLRAHGLLCTIADEAKEAAA